MQRVAVDLFRALQARPDIALDAITLETSWRWTGVRTPPFLLSLLRRIPRAVESKGIEVVLFSSMVTAAVTPLIAARIRQAGATTAAIPVGRDVTLPNRAYQRFVPHVLRELDVVLPISRATAAACLERGADPSKVHVVPCGTDLDRWGAPSDRTRARAELIRELAGRGFRVDPSALLLLSVGRHQERKGFHWFVEEVLPHTPSDVVYLLAGSGPMTGRIREAVENHGLGERVALLGQVSESLLATLYTGSDLFVMPNIPIPGDMEGFGVVMVEAGAAGLPVLAADLEGIRDVIAPGENGVLLPGGDVTAFLEAITAFRDPTHRGAAGARAREYVLTHFSWAGIADTLIGILASARPTSSQQPENAPKDG